ncbi:hypothetical protein, partial [Salmonella sp. SAL04269]|uniref:hypothetical protein n=1 Tax=Salmonella sp. SAL04269 TaxID=3159847 RepID=UPI0039784E5A
PPVETFRKFTDPHSAEAIVGDHESFLIKPEEDRTTMASFRVASTCQRCRAFRRLPRRAATGGRQSAVQKARPLSKIPPAPATVGPARWHWRKRLVQ